MLTSTFVSSPWRSFLASALVPFLVLSSSGRGAEAASFPPSYRFLSLRTEHATVHFHQGLEAMARQAASLADDIVLRYEKRYDYKIGRIQIVLADDEDDPNGF